MNLYLSNKILRDVLSPSNYYLGGTAYKYIKITSAIDADFELDAVEEIAYDPECIPEFSTIALPVASILGLLFFFNHRKRRREQ